MKALADGLYNMLLDMDIADYQEVNEVELENLMDDLELLEEMGNGTLLNVIQMMME